VLSTLVRVESREVRGTIQLRPDEGLILRKA
jgi:hypothetical protein